MRGDDNIKEDIKNFLLRAQANKKTDKKTGKTIHSNFYCLYANMQIDEGEENETAEDPLESPIEKLIKSKWDTIETKYKDYLLDPLDLNDEDLAKELEQIKVLFLEILSLSLQLYANDPLNLPKAVHVTGSKSQSGSKVWKKARYILLTASFYESFLRMTDAEKFCLNLWKDIDLSKVPGVDWGNKNESSAIKAFERKHGGKVTKTGLHISKEFPHIGKLMFDVILQTNCHIRDGHFEVQNTFVTQKMVVL